MGDKNQNPTDPNPKSLHPVYSVTNIQNKVRTLDGDKVTYSDWVKLFKLHAHGYEVLKHIDGSGPPAKTDPSYEAWSKIDSIVLQWIYGTLSDSYLKRVLDTNCTAQQAWDRLQTVFLNNKNSRAATLEHAFTTTTMASCSSLNEYFQRMKDLADQLKDVDHPVSASRLVLQMVTGLPQEYDTVASFIIQADKSWDDAREMIEREQRRQAARQAVLAAHAPPPNTPTNPPNPSNPPPPQPYHPAQTYDNRTPSRGRGRGRNSYRGRGRGRYSYYQHNYPNNPTAPNQSQNYPPSYNPNQQPSYPWWASPPPCPHPAQAPWSANWSRPTSPAPPQQPSNATPPPPPGFGLAAPPPPYPYPNDYTAGYPPSQPVDPLQPTELGTALSALTLNQNIPQWNMDTGASSHITSDQGSQDWTTSFTP
ncbi:hypothetical protein HanIR_Chr01g0002231 [Helianthus annuus]|nr:hypothetical protein HanIR_Chr01g0002231 [Helianthus annuus]